MDHLLRKTSTEVLFKSHFNRGEMIGNGAIGSIFKVIHADTGIEVAAAKQASTTKFNVKRRTEEEVLFHKYKFYSFNKNSVFFKIKLMKRLRHHNVVTFYSSFYTDDGLAIISLLELCDHDLQHCIKMRNNVPFPYETLIDYSCQILCGLKYLHDNKIIHRDIKPAVKTFFSEISFLIQLFQNILMAGNVLKIADFNVSKMLSE